MIKKSAIVDADSIVTSSGVVKDTTAIGTGGGGGAAWGAITGTLATQTDLAGALAARAAADHLHGGVYAPAVHGHGPSEITGTAIVEGDARLTNARNPTVHGHAPAEVTGTAVITTDSRLSDARTPTAHGHAESEVTGLVADLAAKAAASHSHAEADVTGLVSDLAGKAAASHTHAPGDVTGTAVITSDSRLSDARTPTAHNHAGTDVNSGTLDGDRLPALSTTKKGGAPATGTPSGKFLKDDGTWATPAGAGGFTFPVGYVLISKVDTNPATFLGYGTWAKFGAGKVLVGLDSGDSDFDAIGDTPGAKTQTPSAHAGAAVADHAALTHSGAAVGDHAAAATGAASAGSTQRGTTTSTVTLAAHTHQTPVLAHSVTQPNQHAAQAHSVTQPSAHAVMSVVQPSFVVYFWERTA